MGLSALWQAVKCLGWRRLVLVVLGLFVLSTLVAATGTAGGGVSAVQALIWATKGVASGWLEAISRVVAYVIRVPLALRSNYTGQPLPATGPELFPRSLPTPIPANQLPPGWPTPLP
jgi:hypothetical protein